jgi:hypothetical protein
MYSVRLLQVPCKLRGGFVIKFKFVCCTCISHMTKATLHAMSTFFRAWDVEGCLLPRLTSHSSVEGKCGKLAFAKTLYLLFKQCHSYINLHIFKFDFKFNLYRPGCINKFYVCYFLHTAYQILLAPHSLATNKIPFYTVRFPKRFFDQFWRRWTGAVPTQDLNLLIPPSSGMDFKFGVSGQN